MGRFERFGFLNILDDGKDLLVIEGRVARVRQVSIGLSFPRKQTVDQWQQKTLPWLLPKQVFDDQRLQWSPGPAEHNLVWTWDTVSSFMYNVVKSSVISCNHLERRKCQSECLLEPCSFQATCQLKVWIQEWDSMLIFSSYTGHLFGLLPNTIKEVLCFLFAFHPDG